MDLFEPRHDKTSKICVRPVKTPISLGIRPVWSESSLCAPWVAKGTSFFSCRQLRLWAKGASFFSCRQRRLWSDWADAQADLSLHWAHTHFVGFVMSRLIFSYNQFSHCNTLMLQGFFNGPLLSCLILPVENFDAWSWHTIFTHIKL